MRAYSRHRDWGSKVNLTISAICNQACAYCFTADHLAGDAPGFLPVDAFEARLDLLDRSGIDEARLLGGEPTLHPEFAELVARARARGKRIVVFTNGLMPESALASLEALPAEACTVLVNAGEPGDPGYARRRLALRRLGARALPGYNIDRPDAELGFLLDLAAETGCRPVLRLGMAQPCLSGRNRHIHPKQYRVVAQRIAGLAAGAMAQGVRLELDCGFVRCMFTDEEVAMLEGAGADVGWRCNPILDVDTAGRVIHCYPLSGLGSLPLVPAGNAAGLRRAFEVRTRPYRRAGVYPECSTCPFKASGECTGGCLAATVRRFRPAAFTCRAPRGEVA